MEEVRFEEGELIENRYRVLSVVGSGGMGILYRVSDEARDDEIVALKTVMLDAPTMEAAEGVERFQREFQILTQLRHPNLVSVYDFGVTTGGELYFTMEWIEGRSLEPTEQPLEPAATIPLIVQISRALAYLHARGVIHGDLKPSNVLLIDTDTAAGSQVKIVDFGVALETRTPELRARYYTPGYTAPEVKKQRSVDNRMDLYSVGAMWYALLMGEPPFFMPGSERLIQFNLKEALEAQDQIPVEISELVARLLAESPAERYASANEVIEAINEITGSAYALETRETASSYALRVRFVDRESEIEMLQTAWEQARSHEGRLVLVSGGSGVGKTRLLEELVVQAELEGARVARGQCVESGGVAYHPWREVLRVLMRYAEGADGADLEMKRVGAVLATLLPELWERDYMAGVEPPVELEPQAAQQRLNDAIVEVLRATAGLRPVVVTIEDAHWADEATLALLGFLTRVPAWEGLCVCVTYRDDMVDAAHPLVNLKGSQVQRVQVHNLSPQFTTDLVRSMLGLEELPVLLTERVQQTTGGNAFFVQELIRSLAEDGEVLQRTVDGWQVNHAALKEARLPESIRQVVWQRLEQLSVETQRALRWAAIVGPVFWDGALMEVGQVSNLWVQAALDEALEQELIFARDTTAFEGQLEYRFASPAVREVSYESVLRETRREAHGRVAEWLMARSDEDASEHLGLIAHHLERAGRAEQAVAYLTRAGKQAADQFANAEAVDYFSRALDLVSVQDRARRYTLLLDREELYDLQGERDAQRQDLEALKDLAEALGDEQQTEVTLRWARYAEATGDYPAAIEAAKKVIGLTQTAHDVDQEAAGYKQWGYALWRQGKYEVAQMQIEQGLELARVACAREVEADSLRNLGIVSSIQGNYARAMIYMKQALAIYRELDDRQGEGWTLNSLGIVSSHLGDYPGARAYYEQALRICCEVGDQLRECLAVSNLGLLYHHLGQEETSREYSQRALRIARYVDNRAEQAFALTNLGHALVNLGRLAEAADAYQQALALRFDSGALHLAMESRAGLARVSLAEGNPSQALAQVEKILDYLEDKTLHGTYEPFRVYLTCYNVLRANRDPRSESILDTAYDSLRERADKITDEYLRRSFLDNVVAHRTIADEFADRK